MHAIGRRNLLLAATALSLAATGLWACNSPGPAGGGISEDDVVLGAANAPVTLIEYASATCPHCAEFHETVWSQLKANYIDTGKVRFVFREFPTPPPAVAVAGFQVARCGGATPEQYFDRLGEIFRQQRTMFAGGMEGVRRGLINVGGAAGLSEEQVMQCINDEAGAQRIQRLVAAGQREHNISQTPTFIIDGTEFEQAVTYDNLARALDAALAS